MLYAPCIYTEVILLKGIKNMLLRAKNIPELQVETIYPEKSISLCKEFTDEMLKPFIRTGEKISQNKIVLPVWDDEVNLKGNIPPWGYHKFCDFIKREFGLGLVHVQFRNGKKVRKANDFRFRDEKEVQITNFYFLFDFSLRHYIQVNPHSSEEWQKRISDLEQIEYKMISFIWNYITDEKPNFILYNDQFRKRDKKSYLDIEEYLNIMENFLDNTWLYMDLLLIVYFDISIDEHAYLEQEIRRQKRLIVKARNYIERFERKEMFDVYQDYYDREKADSSFGIVTETFLEMDKFIMPRKEKIEDAEWFAYNIGQGYVKIDKKNNSLYPNIAEIERRRSLYSNAANRESENNLLKEIIRRKNN